MNRPAEWAESLRLPVTPNTDSPDDDPRAVWKASGRCLGWPTPTSGGVYRSYDFESFPIFARSLVVEPPAWGRGWRPYQPIKREGLDVAYVWKAADGSVYLP